jgi:predicted ATPase
MLVQRLILQNWRNFQHADILLRDVTYIVGAHATGKSNLLDVFRFLRDICNPTTGGLQAAVSQKGGLSKLRCLHARRDGNVRIEVHLAETSDAPSPLWRYNLAFNAESKGARRVLVTEETVSHRDDSSSRLSRPNADDRDDTALRTQTHLRQVRTNARFRDIADFFGGVLYLHLVPQLLKYPEQSRGQGLESDPFGQGLLEHIAKTPEKTRFALLRRLEAGLKLAIPNELRFVRDEATGKPHLEVQYKNHRPNAGWQREEQWSDGTLRLFGLFWSLLDSNTLLLLEEPELSLNDAIVRQIPLMPQQLQRNSKPGRQVILSTHSDALLSAPIDGRGILRLEAGDEGTKVVPPAETEIGLLLSGLTPAEVILPKARPERVDKLRLF